MDTVAAAVLGFACLAAPLAILAITVVIEAGTGQDDFQDFADLYRIRNPRRVLPERWAQPGVPSLSEAPCCGCSAGIHAACDGDCDCDCPWPFTPRPSRRATIGG